jgi:hypothetical protein
MGRVLGAAVVEVVEVADEGQPLVGLGAAEEPRVLRVEGSKGQQGSPATAESLVALVFSGGPLGADGPSPDSGKALQIRRVFGSHTQG